MAGKAVWGEKQETAQINVIVVVVQRLLSGGTAQVGGTTFRSCEEEEKEERGERLVVWGRSEWVVVGLWW